MSLKDAVNKAGSKWMAGTGPDNDIVISSRVRLARNICGYPFPHFIKEKEAEQVFQAVQLAVSDQELKSVAGELEFTNLAELTDNERMILVEKHLVSPQHIDNPQNRAVVISEDESVSIMVNEEDHLRIQCLQPGLQLEETWALADKIDDLLEKSLDYSFCEKRGYLTSCPTNVGTGLRASVMLHLPCLVMGKQVGKIVHAIAQLGLAVRGYYGEGTEAHGNLFQVSNQVTMGQTEEEIVKNLLTVTQKVVAQERAIRETVIKDNLKFFEDKIYRAFGIMSNARLMTSKEALKNISDLRLGVQLGMLQGLTYGLINELIMLSTPAFLSKAAGRTLNTEERDWFRAETVRKQLTNIQI
ncbi:MAG: protein arginine kinase [Thermincola sp.]|jgi:protein arginine kinase|nr:protein arginine kinase [Thermincola sp.]MDT3704898.1 protein arginine kinase [Thermincola sp.]